MLEHISVAVVGWREVWQRLQARQLADAQIKVRRQQEGWSEEEVQESLEVLVKAVQKRGC